RKSTPKEIFVFLVTMKFAIRGPFGINGCFFGGHLQPSQDADVDLRVEVSAESTVQSRSSFVFDESSVEYAQGFCRWLSYRCRCVKESWRATKFTFEILKESETARRVAKSLLDGTTFRPETPLYYPDELGVKLNQQGTSSPSPDILQFVRSLKRWGIKEYRKNNMGKSKDLLLSCLQALSECDELLEQWDSDHDIRTAEWRRLSYDACSALTQIHLVQKTEGTVKEWIPFEAMMLWLFSEDIIVQSKVRFLRLCALSFRDDDNQAFFFLLLARCLDPTDQQTLDMLRKRHPTSWAYHLATQYLESFQKKRTTIDRVLQTLENVDTQDLEPKFDEECPICLCKIKPVGNRPRQIRQVKKSSCNHYFHEICIRTHVSYRTTCPVCRREWGHD
ncbi:uncharacterized protein PV07_12541, partial [Cladophialophora immunda]